MLSPSGIAWNAIANLDKAGEYRVKIQLEPVMQWCRHLAIIAKAKRGRYAVHLTITIMPLIFGQIGQNLHRSTDIF